METYGDLKKTIKNIQRKQKGEKVGKATIDGILGAIPGLGTAKSTFDVISAAFRKPDTKKTNSWLDKLDVDDEMSAIVDDTVENGFLKMTAKVIDSESDDKPLEQDFNMNQKMIDYLDGKYKGRTITGITEQKSVFDKFFTKFAYKFDKGYPDMNNAQDVLLLETLLEQLVVMEFEDSEGLPEDLLDLKSRINALDGYEVEAIQTKKTGVGTPKGTWIYLKDVSEKGRGLRKDLTDDLVKKGALPPGKVTSNKGAFYLETEDGEIFVIKGAGSKFSTNTNVKEGLVIIFFNALKKDWNEKKDPFTSENYYELLNSLPIITKGMDDTSKKDVGKKLPTLRGENANSSLAALAALNDPLSSAKRLHADYGSYDLIRDGDFEKIRSAGASATGIDKDKWNPGDIYVQLKPGFDAKKLETDAMPWGKLNELFEGQWGEKDADFVAVSLKQEKAQGGKAKGFLKNLNPDLLPADGDKKPLPPIYGLSKEEMQDGYDFDTALGSYKSTVKGKLGNQEFIDFKIGENPPTIQQKKFKLAAYKALDYLITWFKNDAGETNPVTALVKMAAYGMSISGVNPTYFKLIGKTDGSTADIPEKFPAGATAKLTPGTKIKIYDGNKNGSLIIDMTVNIMVGDDKISQYQLKVSARSNGGEQNTIEISKAKKL